MKNSTRLIRLEDPVQTPKKRFSLTTAIGNVIRNTFQVLLMACGLLAMFHVGQRHAAGFGMQDTSSKLVSAVRAEFGEALRDDYCEDK